MASDGGHEELLLMHQKVGVECLRALDFQTLLLAPLFIWILDILKSPPGHLKSQPEESRELCG